VGSSFKERVIEFFLAVSGFLFYHLILRPIDYWQSRKKEKACSRTPKPEGTEKNFSPSAPRRIEIE
jgi:hypothetical protein